MSQPRDSKEVLQRLEEGLPWVRPLALRIRSSTGVSVDLDDLLGYGQAGLLDASRRFDPARGVSFRTFAAFRIRGAILDGIRQLAYLPRRVHERVRAEQVATLYSEGAAEDRADTTGLSAEQRAENLRNHLAGMATAIATGLVAIAASDDGEPTAVAAEQESPEELSSRRQRLAEVRRAIEQLPEPEATIVRRHYLEGDQFDTVAASLGLSRSWASRLHTRAMDRLSRRLGALS